MRQDAFDDDALAAARYKRRHPTAMSSTQENVMKKLIDLGKVSAETKIFGKEPDGDNPQDLFHTVG